MIRTRFAPSPTGYMHIGNFRTALYADIFAKKNGGKFLLRIEDTDQERSVPHGIVSILESLEKMGINPDEGVIQKNGAIAQIGEFGPYIQSERLDIYHQYAEQLLTAGHAYYCFCTAERLTQLREQQQVNKQPTGYDGHCKSISLDEAKKRVANGEKHVIRLNMPKSGETVFTDLIRGEIRFKNELVDDQVLIKTDGFPTYHLAVVVDDHHMQISHVIRGEEWISSTPKHLQLYKYFDWEAPQFAHLPLLLNTDKSKLSKRQGDVALNDYLKKGYLPQALINFVAFLGWNPGDDRELFTIDELVEAFDLSKVNKSGAVFNLEKLDWYNREYLKRLEGEQLLKWGVGFLKQAAWFRPDLIAGFDDVRMAAALALEKERVTNLVELCEAVRFVFEPVAYTGEQLIWKKSDRDTAQKVLSSLLDLLNTKSVQLSSKGDWEDLIGKWIAEQGLSNGEVLWPLRVALSGQDKSPGPYEIAAVLGCDEVINRLQAAKDKLEKLS